MLFSLLLLWLATWPLVLPTPDCGSDLDQDEDLQIQVPPGVLLTGVPGTDSRVPVMLTNYQDEDISLIITYQEAFPVYNLTSYTTHVELVSSVTPSLLMVPANTTMEATVLLHTSAYVPQLYRSKVTVIAKNFITNITQALVRREVSFYFTVLKSGSSLAAHDTHQPTCSPLTMCTGDENCPLGPEESCEDQSWVARFLVEDSGSGLAYPVSKWPSEATINKTGFILGSTEEHTVSVTTSCCYSGLRLEVRDLAGNTVLCEVGEVVAAAGSLRSELGILLSLCFWGLRYRG